MHLPVRDLTPDAFAPYGTVIQRPSEDAEASGDGWSWWSQVADIPRIDAPYAVGFLALEPSSQQFDWAEYHLHSQEVIVPLGHECLIYVGAPSDEPNWERFEVFRIRADQAVILNEGVWHGAPFATSRPLSALVLLREGTGKNDLYKAIHPAGPITIEHES